MERGFKCTTQRDHQVRPIHYLPTEPASSTCPPAVHSPPFCGRDVSGSKELWHLCGRMSLFKSLSDTSTTPLSNNHEIKEVKGKCIHFMWRGWEKGVGKDKSGLMEKPTHL